jgi:hypothetical protein
MKRLIKFGLALALGLATGCVERRMIINAEPPGAAVFVNYQPLGTGPADYPFLYYGAYHFTFIRDGYETLQVDQKVEAPWYQWIGFDFFSENLYPFKLRDIRCFNYTMLPVQTVPPTDVLNRGKELQSRAATITPLTPDGKPAAPSDGLPAGSSNPFPAPLPRNTPPPPNSTLPGNVLNPGGTIGSGDPNNPRR